MSSFNSLLPNMRSCTICQDYLPLAPKPVLQLHPKVKILITGQAPGRRVHASGIPFDDMSSKRLREWLEISPNTFYDAQLIAIVPMGLCYPGTGKLGDLPSRPECAQKWREPILKELLNIELMLLVGQYA